MNNCNSIFWQVTLRPDAGGNGSVPCVEDVRMSLWARGRAGPSRWPRRGEDGPRRRLMLVGHCTGSSPVLRNHLVRW